MSRIKICGLKRPEDICYVNRYQPDYVGFVFAKSPRQITPMQAAGLKKELKPEILSVGVFVNEEIDTIVRLVEERIIDLIQLHGDEDIAYIRKLQDELDQMKKKEDRFRESPEGGKAENGQTPKMIKAIRVSALEDVERGLAYPTDYLLFDTYRKGQYGGSGEAFNWELLEEVKRPFFLAGGLTTGNIREAMNRLQPYCLDVSSGAETDGIKDREKIRNLVEAVKAAEGSREKEEQGN